MKNFCTAAITTLLLTSTVSAGLLADGIYELNNHPDGSAAPPLYGLRLDGLDGSNSDFTFDFETNGAAMFMDVDVAAGTIRIFGQAFGGKNQGSTYAANGAGLWDIDFTYAAGVQVNGMTIEVAPPTPASNNGTITFLDAGDSIFAQNQVIDLFAYETNNGTAFLIKEGHRGFAGHSGFGWLAHGTSTNNVKASDWLFTVGREIPVPGAALLAALGLSLVGTLKRRFA